MTQDVVVEKIRAILRKADESANSNEHEREVAMQMANRLLVKYGLSMQDIGTVQTDDSGREFEDRGAFTISDAPDDVWKGVLLNSIAKVYFCKVYFTHTYMPDGRAGHHLFIVGRKAYTETVRSMYEFITPQIEREYQAALLGITQTSSPHMQQQARLAREYAIRAVSENRMDGTSTVVARDLSDEELAEIGRERFERIRTEAGSEMALVDVMTLCGIDSANYAKKVRAFIKRGAIAGAMPENMGVWRRSFYSAAVSRIRARLRELMQDELADHGNAGVALVKDENADLKRFMDELGLKLGRGSTSQRKVDYDGAASGDAAGQRADLTGSKKVASRGPRQLNA